MGYSYDYGFDYSYGFPGSDGAMMEELMGGIGITVAIIVVMVLLFALAIGIISYVFRSIGLYTIAKRRGIRNPWMAWVPLLHTWTIGSISDQYQYVVKGRVKNKRTLLLVMYCVTYAVSISVNVLNVVYMWSASAGDGIWVAAMVLSLVNLVVAVVAAVFYYIAMYDLYTSCSPANNVLFLVLGIVFQITEPFFVFFNRKKDGGMPPRREAPVVTALPELTEEPEPPDYL